MKRHRLLLGLLLLSFLLLSVSIAAQQRAVWWDSAVYIGMGKYYWSAGQSGFSEPSRPPALPLLLGAFWNAGLDTILSGTILIIVFSLGTVFLTFKIGEKLFGANTGLLAAFLLGFSFTFLSFSHRILTEIPSSFFLLLGALLLLKQKPVLGGIAFGLSFLTRFYQLLPIIIILAAFHLQRRHWRRELLLIISGFSIPLLPYLLLGAIAYGNPMLPFTLQLYLSMHTGTIYAQPLLFYAASLINENILLLSLAALPLVWKKNQHLRLLAWIALIPLLLYTLAPHKEMRLLLPLLPFVSLLAAFCTIYLSHYLAQRFAMPDKTILFLFCAIFLCIGLSHTLLFIIHPSSQPSPQQEFFQEYLQEREHAGQHIWISSPLYALRTDAPVSGLMYYPGIRGEPDLALVNTCDFLGNDREYGAMTSRNLDTVMATLKQVYSSREKGCVYTIYGR